MTAAEVSRETSPIVTQMEVRVNKIFRTSLILSLVLSLALSGCAAVQFGSAAAPAPMAVLGAGETIKGLQAVVSGAPGTFAMMSAEGDLILMAWPKGSEYAFTYLTTGGAAKTALDSNALRMATEGFANSVKYFETHGWQYLTPDKLPAAVSGAIMAYTLDLVLAGVQTLPTILVVPVIVLPESNDPIPG